MAKNDISADQSIQCNTDDVIDTCDLFLFSTAGLSRHYLYNDLSTTVMGRRFGEFLFIYILLQ